MANAMMDATENDTTTVPSTDTTRADSAAPAKEPLVVSAAPRKVASPPDQVEQPGKNRDMARFMLVMVASIIAMLVLTMGMMLVLTDVSVLAAFGLGLYCAFWLGGGFGTIFGSASVFGGDH